MPKKIDLILTAEVNGVRHALCEEFRSAVSHSICYVLRPITQQALPTIVKREDKEGLIALKDEVENLAKTNQARFKGDVPLKHIQELQPSQLIISWDVKPL